MLKRQNPKRSEQTGGYLIFFEIAERILALPTKDVARVLPMAALSGEPGGTSILAGFLNLGGDAIPILHLSRILEVPDPSIDAHTRLIIVRHARDRYGLIVNKILQITAVASLEVVRLPSLIVANTAIRIDTGVVPIISVESLLLEQEKRRISELRKNHHRRLRELQETNA